MYCCAYNQAAIHDWLFAMVVHPTFKKALGKIYLRMYPKIVERYLHTLEWKESLLKLSGTRGSGRGGGEGGVGRDASDLSACVICLRDRALSVN